MATTDIHFRIDEQVKKDIEELLDKIGISMSDYLNMACKSAVREQRLPFSTSVGDMDLPENMRIETKDELISFLDKRMTEDDGTRYTLDEVKAHLGLTKTKAFV